MLIEDKLYKEIVKNIIIQTVDIVFLNSKNQILLWLRENNPLKWVYYLPWWRRNKNERILDSAKRKSKEELWIDISTNKLKFLGVYDDIYNNSMYKNIWTHCSPIIYAYKLSSEEEKNIKNDSQHSEFKFFDLNDESLHKMVKERILNLDILKNL